MRCDRVKDLLLTEYRDKELDERTQKDVENHLAGCEGCRAINERLRSVSLAFHAVEIIEPPQRVWENIRREIVRAPEPRHAAGFDLVKQWIGRFTVTPRFAALRLATAAATVLIVLGLYTFLREGSSGNRETDAGFFIASLIDDNEDNGYDLGTDIERYFL
ncbi:MAG: zf-HC2 domain-containing protein [Candidatus Omnitrophica bacterium]|nr:zf-HC2 domain-containing protein [Candidatus Omnitrophota bacterium]